MLSTKRAGLTDALEKKASPTVSRARTCCSTRWFRSLSDPLRWTASRHIGLVDSIEHWTSDWREALLGSKVDESHPGVSVVLIDEETLELLGSERVHRPTAR